MLTRTRIVWVLLVCAVVALAWIFWIKPAQDRQREEDLLTRQRASEQRLSEIADSVERRDGRVIKASISRVPNRRSLRVLKDAAELEELSFFADPHDEEVAFLNNHRQIRRLYLSGPGITNRSLETIGRMNGLEELHLTGTRITDDGFAKLSDLKQLTQIALAETPVDGSGLKHLPSLRVIEAAHSLIGDEELATIAGLSELRVLRLAGTRVQGRGLEHLAPLKHLQFLTLGDAQLTDTSGLKSLNQVQFLSLTNADVAPEALADIVAMKGLISLSLHGPTITDAYLAPLADARQISRLSLSQTDVSDAGLVHLQGLKQLRFLSVDGERISEEAIQRLSQSLPGTSIRYGNRRLGPEWKP